MKYIFSFLLLFLSFFMLSCGEEDNNNSDNQTNTVNLEKYNGFYQTVSYQIQKNCEGDFQDEMSMEYEYFKLKKDNFMGKTVIMMHDCKTKDESSCEEAGIMLDDYNEAIASMLENICQSSLVTFKLEKNDEGIIIDRIYDTYTMEDFDYNRDKDKCTTELYEQNKDKAKCSKIYRRIAKKIK